MAGAIASVGTMLIQFLNWRINRAAEHRKALLEAQQLRINEQQIQMNNQQIELNRLSLKKITSPLTSTTEDLERILFKSDLKPGQLHGGIGIVAGLPLILVLLIIVFAIHRAPILQAFGEFILLITMLWLALLIKNIVNWIYGETANRIAQLRGLHRPVEESKAATR